MGIGEVARALEKRQLWEKSEISKMKRHSFEHINPGKLQCIMLNPPSGVLPINH